MKTLPDVRNSTGTSEIATPAFSRRKPHALHPWRATFRLRRAIVPLPVVRPPTRLRLIVSRVPLTTFRIPLPHHTTGRAADEAEARHFVLLCDAIVHRREVRITYRKPNDEAGAEPRVVHPLHWLLRPEASLLIAHDLKHGDRRSSPTAAPRPPSPSATPPSSSNTCCAPAAVCR